jgi:hypothetical protein
MFFDSDTIKDMPAKFPGSGRLNIITAGSFALVTGTYTINIALFTNNVMADYMQNAYSFTIEEGDFLGNGKLPSGQYMFIPEQSWAITSSI